VESRGSMEQGGLVNQNFHLKGGRRVQTGGVKEGEEGAGVFSAAGYRAA